MRVCAIDCGSNSFHLLIADVERKDQFEIIVEDKSLLYLGAEVATSGEISKSSLLRAKRVIRHYKTLILRHNVEVVKCVATSAIRSANNGDLVIKSLTKTLGHEIKVISGVTEAELIFRGISAVSSLPETRVLNVDMGGGSLELMVGQRNFLEYATSEPLGASRLSRTLKVCDPLSKEDIKEIEKQCSKYFIDFKKHFSKSSFSNIVVSSGTLNNLVTMARSMTDSYVPATNSNVSATSSELKIICDLLISSNKKDRNKIIGYDNNRDEYIQTAAVICNYISTMALDDSPWYSSSFALREGLVLKVGDEIFKEEYTSQKDIANATINTIDKKLLALERTIIANNKKSKVNIYEHGQYVAKLTSIVFSELSELHTLDNNELDILEYAARLHDLGETISRTKHDVHGAYILFNTPLPGFSPNEATMLRSIVRCHRTKNPKTSDKYVGRLNDKDLEKAKWLIAILRIADGADAGKSNLVENIKISIKPDVIYIYLFSKFDLELEVYSTRRKRLLLEELSNRDVIVSQSEY